MPDLNIKALIALLSSSASEEVRAVFRAVDIHQADSSLWHKSLPEFQEFSIMQIGLDVAEIWKAVLTENEIEGADTIGALYEKVRERVPVAA